MLDEGVLAELKVGDEHLRPFSEHSAQGVQASVYNVNAKNWIAPSEIVDDIEQGKDRFLPSLARESAMLRGRVVPAREPFAGLGIGIPRRGQPHIRSAASGHSRRAVLQYPLALAVRFSQTDL
jgi:hypothetical protein